MLIQFNFENYRSFRNEVSLDLTATRITEHGNHTVSDKGENLLPVAVIYGANASGKSNIFKAFEFMHKYVFLSFGLDDEKDSKEKNVDSKMLPQEFRFDPSAKKSGSMFELFFTLSSEVSARVYQYGFRLIKGLVAEEWLYYKTRSSSDKKIFSREYSKVEFEGNLISEAHQTNIRASLATRALVLSLGAKLRVPKLLAIRKWFYNNELCDYGDMDELDYRSKNAPTRFYDEKVQKQVLSYLTTFEPSLLGFKLEEVKTDSSSDEEKKFTIDTLHKQINGEGTQTLPLSEESSGTLKMFSLFDSLKETLTKGSIFFVDELNARLHPLLVRNIVLTYLNPETNPKHAQLIFTSHDAWQLSNNLFRRDEIWLTEKSEDGISSLYSLADFTNPDGDKIRKDENYEKNYMLGRYGAIPSVKAIDLWKEE